LKPSLIYGVFSILIPNFLISSLSNKFYSITLEFGQKNAIAWKKESLKIKLKKQKKLHIPSTIIYVRMNSAIFNRKTMSFSFLLDNNYNIFTMSKYPFLCTKKEFS
jgi:hypothetical protein